MVSNYFFIDGSTLLSQIRALRKNDSSFESSKLDPEKFIYCLNNLLRNITENSFKRAVFYFPQGENELWDYLLKTGFSLTGNARDIVYKFCGKKIKRSKKYDEFLETVPDKFKDRCSKSEKGVDIEICCDALKLAALNKMERLIILTNDGDFIPLCRVLKDFGCNISLIHLTDLKRNEDLIRECDSYDFVQKGQLGSIFYPQVKEEGKKP